MSEQYQHFTPSDFDKYDCVKLSKTLFLALVYLLRAYIAWLMSVTNMQDQVGVIEFLYPDPKLFYLNLMSGALGLGLLVIMSLRRPLAAAWVQNIWPKTRMIIVVALVFDFAVSCYGYWVLSLLSDIYLYTQAALSLLILILCYQSQRLRINLSEFPEPVPEK